MEMLSYTGRLLQGGLGNLAAYLAAHVLLCLLPAFFMAGALAALIPQTVVTRYLGRNAPKYISYPAAALGGFVLAVCSCTIMPLFAGIYKRGAGLGPAITFLFVGPAINILALTYTGVALGLDIALARVVLSIIFGIGIGLIMALIFREDEEKRAGDGADAFAAHATLERGKVIFFLLLLGLLLAGTLSIGVFTRSYGRFVLPVRGMDQFQEWLDVLVPHDPNVGEEGVTVQGTILIGLLSLIGISAWFGFGRVDEGYNPWTWVALGLIALTLVVAAVGMVPQPDGLVVLLTGKALGVFAALIGLGIVAYKYLDAYEIQEFLWETWRFVKQIFPLLLVGVFAVGVVRGFIKPAWIMALAGRNTVLANLAGVLFGVFMYFPTLVEVPIANMFLSLGMHRGPLLAYLMADPELSLQSILITSSVIGKKKTWVYVGWVTVFTTLAGLLYGAWVDGAAILRLLIYLVLGVAVLAAFLYRLSARQQQRTSAPAGAPGE
ncbi:MAG: permease [Anaerolineales bacterium]